MIPVLSMQPAPSGWVEPSRDRRDDLTDFELGGAAIGVASQDSSYLWTATSDGTTVRVNRDGVPPVDVLTEEGITEVSLAFDQTMNVHIAYVAMGEAKFRYWDTLSNSFQTMALPGARNPRCCSDVKVPALSNYRDLLVFYLRGDKLYARAQRDRFTIEHEQVPDSESASRLGTNTRLVDVGMDVGHRLKIALVGSGGQTPGDVDPYWSWVSSLIRMTDPVSPPLFITDEKGVVWTGSSQVAMVTEQVKFGTVSMRMSNLTGHDRVSGPPGLIQSGVAFTAEGWVYITDLQGFQLSFNPLLSQSGGAGGTDQNFGLYEGKVCYQRGAAMPGGQINLVGPTLAAVNHWNHIEIGYNGTTFYLFLNGRLEAWIDDSSGWHNTGQPFNIGYAATLDAWRLGLKGFIGPVRITSGVCRHTGNFVPPASNFPVAGP